MGLVAVLPARSVDSTRMKYVRPTIRSVSSTSCRVVTIRFVAERLRVELVPKRTMAVAGSDVSQATTVCPKRLVTEIFVIEGGIRSAVAIALRVRPSEVSKYSTVIQSPLAICRMPLPTGGPVAVAMEPVMTPLPPAARSVTVSPSGSVALRTVTGMDGMPAKSRSMTLIWMRSGARYAARSSRTAPNSGGGMSAEMTSAKS